MANIDYNCLYRCLKKSGDPLKLGLLCQWDGSSLDYMAHLKKSHPESCFDVTKNKKFCWRIPSDSGFDKGIVQLKSKMYLYEIYYDKSDNRVYIALSADANISQEYKIVLYKNDFETLETTQKFNSLNSLCTPIVEKFCVTLSNETLNEYCDSSERLKFKFLL